MWCSESELEKLRLEDSQDPSRSALQIRSHNSLDPENAFHFSLPTRFWQIEACRLLTLEFIDFVLPLLDSSIPISREDRPLQTVPVGGDGNCFFSCLSYILTGTEDAHSALRQLLCMFIQSFYEELLVDSKYVESSKMQVDGTWAGEVEVTAAAALLNCPIHLYSSIGNPLWGPRWHSHLPNAEIQTHLPLQSTAGLYPLHLNQNHFLPVLYM